MKLLCIGDSITFGYETRTTKRWTNLLAKDLAIQVINCGINGDTTAGMLGRFQASLIEHKPTHVIILGGANDLWFGLKDEQIISNIFAMCRQAKHYNVVPIIGIPTPYFILNELNFLGEDYAECIRGFQQRLIAFSKLKDLQFVEFGKDLKHEYFMDDGLHPNEHGHLAIAKNIAHYCKNFLKMT